LTSLFTGDLRWLLFRILYTSGVVTRERALRALGRERGTRYAAECNEEELTFYSGTDTSLIQHE
jgi:hypothetical protein